MDVFLFQGKLKSIFNLKIISFLSLLWNRINPPPAKIIPRGGILYGSCSLPCCACLNRRPFYLRRPFFQLLSVIFYYSNSSKSMQKKSYYAKDAKASSRQLTVIYYRIKQRLQQERAKEQAGTVTHSLTEVETRYRRSTVLFCSVLCQKQVQKDYNSRRRSVS